MPVEERRVDALDGVGVEGVDGEDVEVSQESGGDGVPAPAASERSHRADENGVCDVTGVGAAEFVRVDETGVTQLPQQFEGRVRSELIWLGEVQIVHKQKQFFATRRKI